MNDSHQTQYEALVSAVNQNSTPLGQVEYLGSHPLGPVLSFDRFQFKNGLRLILCVDHSAPVFTYHSWFHVGSRHEHEGKTGLSHLLEHLMFNETKHHAVGEFDRLLEEAGAESNAATWLDWTQYNVTAPKEQMTLVVELEADRMASLVLREPQIVSEKEVVANERRYRVDDDVEGAMSERLWATAFTHHAYRWPTIGWMQDINNFTIEDCSAFYQTYYAPNNTTLVVVGDVQPDTLLLLISRAYGSLPAAEIPLEDVRPEPPQLEERRVAIQEATSTEKLAIGYVAPALGDSDYAATLVLIEVLVGGQASRLIRRLTHDLELATEVRGYVGPFKHPGLIEFFISARSSISSEAILAVFDEELELLKNDPVAQEEIDRARARIELGVLSGLETVEGKASTLGFYEVVTGRPAAAFEQLDELARILPSDLRGVARRYLNQHQRSIIVARPKKAASVPEIEIESATGASTS